MKIKLPICIACILLKAIFLTNIAVSSQAAAPNAPWDVELIDQQGNDFSMQQTQGKIRLVHFIFTHCAQACPTQTSNLVKVQRKLDPSTSERTVFISLSIDPERDDFSALKEFAQNRGVDFSNWTLATGKESNLDQLSNYFNANGIPASDGQLDHRMVVFLLNPQGQFLQTFTGSNLDINRIVTDVQTAVELFTN